MRRSSFEKAGDNVRVQFVCKLTTCSSTQTIPDKRFPKVLKDFAQTCH